MSHIIKAAAGIAIGTVAIGGSATIIPLTPILILAGMICGTVVAVKAISNPKEIDKRFSKIQTTKGGDGFYIQSLSGDFCVPELGADFGLTCNRKNVHERESFRVLKLDDGHFAFQASNKKYISIDKHKGGLLIASQDKIGDLELFTFEQHDGAYVAFKASNGKYVSRLQDASNSLTASAKSVGKSELFRTLIDRNQVTMKDPIIIAKKIIIEKTIVVKIDILEHEEAVKHKHGRFWGTLINWVDWFGKAREVVKAEVSKEIDLQLKPRIEEQIDIKLSVLLCEEVSQKITQELEKKKIVATVLTEMK